MKTDHERLKEILAEAAGIDTPEARATYLEAACEGDADLRQRVTALLAAHDRAGDFLAHSVVPPEPPPASEGPGSVIGRYKLLEEIGEGGFHAVVVEVGEEHVLGVLGAATELVDNLDRPRSEDVGVGERAGPFSGEVQPDFQAAHLLDGGGVAGERAGDQVHWFSGSGLPAQALDEVPRCCEPYPPCERGLAGSANGNNWYRLARRRKCKVLIHCRESSGELGRFRAAEFAQKNSAENSTNMESSS